MSWDPFQIHYTDSQLERLHGLAKKPFDVVVDVGSPTRGLEAALRHTGALVVSSQDSDRSGVRPSKEVAELLRTKRVLVCMTDPPTDTVFMWASMLGQPKSLLVVQSRDDRNWPDFSKITCSVVENEGGLLILKRGATQEGAPAPAPTSKRPLPRRPLRSVFIGDLRYGSYYRLGVTQGMSRLGAWHREISIFDSTDKIARQVAEARPEIVWTHMLLWAPINAIAVYELLEMCRGWRRDFGSSVLIQDGDPRLDTRFPHDVSDAVDVALVNYDTSLRAEWGVERVHWPYAALSQAERGDLVPELRAQLGFAGTLRDSGIYQQRTDCVRAIEEQVPIRTFPGEDKVNTYMQMADVAASCEALLGFGRPEIPGWLDARIFTIPGAGGVLIHDDVGGFLEPNKHYIPCERYNAQSVLNALEEAKKNGDAIRQAAFDHVQGNQTYEHRCQQIIDHFFE